MTFSNFTLPAITINNYVWDVMKKVDSTFSKQYGQTVPFFPINDAKSGTKSWENKPYVIYDRILRNTGKPFYPIKREHLIYAVKGSAKDALEWSMAIQYILDRMDDAAQDINAWNREQTTPSNVYFHHLKAFQTQGAENREFSNRSYYIAQFTIEAEYHLTDPIESFL
jgi:hypothetical protein